VPSLYTLFAHVCGQQNCWAPGGMPLPFCHRCTGLYAGGLVAALTCGWLRPAPATRTLWLHGLLMLQIVPFGYHWLTQDAAASTLTGQLFAYGLVYYLALLPLAHFSLWRPPSRARAWAYGAIVLAGLLAVQVAARSDDARAGSVLAWAGALGLSVYAALVLGNLMLLGAALWTRLRPAIA
jgi:uncharacterized membrane protein